MSIIKKMESDVESVLDALIAPTGGISPQEAADYIYTIGTEFFKVHSSPGSLADGEDDDAAPCNGPTTPGVPTFFYQLWETVISHVRLAPVEEQAHDECISRRVEFISRVKAKPQPDGKDWLLPGAIGRWDDLPRLAWSTRDYYDFIDSETWR
ncbi:unnamed protein product [Rhizoctonia solani]|uniref:Uncharacterized protein n=1 Tax=Rhizoctonia solani TaxID=456999 RepID=A0A8H3E5S1_9AGAM|nr:unnamed protein product [Rhizoctonia solani]